MLPFQWAWPSGLLNVQTFRLQLFAGFSPCSPHRLAGAQTGVLHLGTQKKPNCEQNERGIKASRLFVASP